MHFNRTQLAAKTHVRLFALAILMFLLSSCIEEIDLGTLTLDLEKIFSEQYNFSVPVGNSPSFSVDSIGYDSISIYKISSHIEFDSVIALTGFVFNCMEVDNQNEVMTVKEQVVDTLDFKVNGIYHYKTRIKALKTNTSYMIYGRARFLIGKDTMDTFTSFISYRTP